MTPGAAAPRKVTLVPGDGIGPQVIAAARAVIDAAGVAVAWDEQHAGTAALETHGTLLPEALVESARETGAVLKGPLAASRDGISRSPNTTLRDALGLVIGVRPCRTWPGVPTPFEGVDVVVVRMTREDLYAGVQVPRSAPGAALVRRALAEATGVELPEDAGISVKFISATAALEAARAAMRWAAANGRRRLTIVHKTTVMHATDGLFVDAALAAAEELGGLEVEERLVDAVCAELVRTPGRLDVLFAPMLYGDILSDLCAGLTGGLGLAPGASYGPACAVFEPVHGTALRYAGTDRANPAAAILSGALLLRHLGETVAAERIEAAVAAVVAEGRSVTSDLRPGRAGGVSTGEMVGAVTERLG